MKTKTSKKITAILLCCIFVICGVLSGCSSIGNAKKEKIFAEIKEKADSYEIEFSGYRIEVVTNSGDFNKDPASGMFELNAGSYPKTVISGDREYEFAWDFKTTWVQCDLKSNGKTETHYIKLNSVFKEKYFEFFVSRFESIAVYNETVFFVTAQKAPTSIFGYVISEECRPSAFFVWDFSENKLKYAGYCRDFVSHDKFSDCADSRTFKIVEEK